MLKKKFHGAESGDIFTTNNSFNITYSHLIHCYKNSATICFCFLFRIRSASLNFSIPYGIRLLPNVFLLSYLNN